MPPPTWPPILTDADWQKKKGTFSKFIGKTGVGEAMIAAKAAFDTIDFMQMDATSIAPKDRDIPIIRERQDDAKAYYNAKVVPAREMVKKLIDAAEATEKKFKSNKLVPASSGKHAADVVKAADALWITLKDNSTWAGEAHASFEKMIAVKQKNATDEIKKLDVTVANLEKALKSAASDMTVKFWSIANDSPHQRCRSMCNAIRNIPALKAVYWKTWQPFGDEYHRDVKAGTPNEKDLMKAKITTVAKALKEFKAKYKDELGMG